MRGRVAGTIVACLCAGAISGCGDDRASPPDTVIDSTIDVEDDGDAAPFVALERAEALEGVRIRHDFDRAGGLFSAPVPSEDLRVDGAVAVRSWPNPGDNAFIATIVDIVHEPTTAGFGQTSAIYLPLTGAVDEARLPGAIASVADDAPVFVVSVDASDDARGQRRPIIAHYAADAGPFGAPHLLSALPLQGAPLRPGTLHAAVVLRSLGDGDGQPLGRDATLADLLAGRPVPALSDTARADYDAALAVLVREVDLDPDDLAGLAVFRTDDASAAMAPFVAAARALPAPAPGPFTLSDVFDGFCAFEATLDMPMYQHGAPPYASEDGDWRYDADGAPLLAGYEEARIVVTVPRGAAPDEGWPTVVFIRTGGGGDRPLVDRGARAVAGGEAIEPGSGPARNFAAAGFAGVSVDGPHGGLRNVTEGDEQFLVFNVLNPRALRDNVRQSALEIALVADVVEALAFDASACPGGGDARFDAARLALMGHSTGAAIAVPAIAWEPRYRALILSGAGGSWIENVVYKERPLHVAPIAQAILGYGDRTVSEHDPAVNLLQWAGEAADVPVFGARARASTEHVLMLQGIVDHYILPPIANATSLALALDLAGPALDATHPELSHFTPLAELLPLVGADRVAFPATGTDGGGARTRIVVQHAEDGVEDGHEVVFQTGGPKHQYRCFLETWAAGGAPRVPAAAGEWDECE